MIRYVQKRLPSIATQGVLCLALACVTPALSATQSDTNLRAPGNTSENAKVPPESGHWFRDEHGCKVWTTTSVADKRANWSGLCVDGYAEGEGVVVWYAYDYVSVGPSKQRRKMFSKTFEHKDGGNFVRGKLIGRGTQLWEDGIRFEGDFVEGHQTNNGVYSWNRDDVIRAKIEVKPPITEVGLIRENYGCKAAYPRESLLAEEEGMARTISSIDAKGQLQSTRIAKSSGFLRLDKASIMGLIKCWPDTTVPQEAKEVVNDYVWSLQ